jgi:WD40 repeat protein
MFLIEPRGYRVLAMSVIPISGEQTQIYGSRDAGQTILNEDPEFNTQLKQLTKELNLKTHIIGGKELHTAVDCEGHKGTDGRFYMLDFARMFPPEAPTGSSPKNSHLFRMLRPEFIQSYSSPLNPDAFSRFIENEKSCEQDNVEVFNATKYLLEVKIPLLVDMLTSHKTFDPSAYPKDLHISKILHSHGVNVRHMGIMLQLLLSKRCDEEDVFVQGWIKILKAEIVYRAMKTRIRYRFRTLHSGNIRYRHDALEKLDENAALLQVLNSILWKKPPEEATSFSFIEQMIYQEQLKDQIEELPFIQKIISEKFGLASRFVKTHFSVDTLPRSDIFYKIAVEMKILFTPHTMTSRATDEGFSVPIDESEILSIEATTEELNVVSFADGICLLSKALDVVGDRSIQHLRMSIEKLENARTSISETFVARELFEARFSLAISLMKEPEKSLQLLDECVNSQWTQALRKRTIADANFKAMSSKVQTAQQVVNYAVKAFDTQCGKIFDVKFCDNGELIVVTSITSQLYTFKTEDGSKEGSGSVVTDTDNEWIRSIAMIDNDHLMVGSKVLKSKLKPKGISKANSILKNDDHKPRITLRRDSSSQTLDTKLESVSDLKEMKEGASVRYTIRAVTLNFFDQVKRDDFVLNVDTLVIDEIYQTTLDIRAYKMDDSWTLIACGIGSSILIVSDFNKKTSEQKRNVLNLGGDFRIIAVEVADVCLAGKNSTYLFCGSSDSTIRIVDLRTQQILEERLGIPDNQNPELGHWDEIRSLCMLTVGKSEYLASAGTDATIRVWNLSTLACDKVLRGHADGVLCIKQVPVWNLLASTSSDGTVRLWSLDSWCCVRILSGYHKKRIYCLDVHATETSLVLATGGSEGRLCIWKFSKNLELSDEEEKRSKGKESPRNSGGCRPS